MRTRRQVPTKQNPGSEVGDLGAAASLTPIVVVGIQNPCIKSAGLYLSLVKVEQANSRTHLIDASQPLVRVTFPTFVS